MRRTSTNVPRSPAHTGVPVRTGSTGTRAAALGRGRASTANLRSTSAYPTLAGTVVSVSML